MNTNIKTEIGIGLIMVIAIFFGMYVWQENKKQEKIFQSIEAPKNIERKKCPQEIRICPDITSVGRVRPNCEFARCPRADKNYIQDEEACKKYSEILSKYGTKEYGSANINSYDRKSNGTLCLLRSAKNTVSVDSFDDSERKILSILKDENWQDTGTGADKPSIGSFGSNSIYKRDKQILVFERGITRDSGKVQECINDNNEQDFANDDFLFECINKIEAEMFFAIMVGKENN